jgi:hypothetical protein
MKNDYHVYSPRMVPTHPSGSWTMRLIFFYTEASPLLWKSFLDPLCRVIPKFILCTQARIQEFFSRGWVHPCENKSDHRIFFSQNKDKKNPKTNNKQKKKEKKKLPRERVSLLITLIIYLFLLTFFFYFVHVKSQLLPDIEILFRGRRVGVHLSSFQLHNMSLPANFWIS